MSRRKTSGGPIGIRNPRPLAPSTPRSLVVLDQARPRPGDVAVLREAAQPPGAADADGPRPLATGRVALRPQRHGTVQRRADVLPPVDGHEPRVEPAMTQIVHEATREIVAFAVDRAGGKPQRVVLHICEVVRCEPADA